MKAFSTTNTYSTSDGERLSRKDIETRIRAGKEYKIERQHEHYGYNFCEDCGRSGGERFDVSHEVSVKECLESGEAEKSWSVDNLKIRCRGCHERHDGLI